MKFQLSDSQKIDSFILIFSGLKNFTDNINMIIKEEGIFVQGMDNAHVSVYELFIDKDWFECFECEISQTLGISIPILNKILHTKTENQVLVMQTHGNSPDNLDIEFTSNESTSYNKYFQIPLMDIDSEQLCIPDTDYQADIEFNSKHFKTLMGELSTFDETLNMIANEQSITFEAKSTEGNMKVVIPFNDIESYAIESGTELELSFAIKYITYMSNFNKLGNTCSIHISENIPLKFQFNLDDKSYMKFYLAPKICDD
jgi:proliferating cell nuclear antigen